MQMRSIVTDRVAWSVCRSVTVVNNAKTAQLIEMPFGLRTRVGPRNHVLTAGVHTGAMASTTESSICGGDTACCQITLTSCFKLQRLIRLSLSCQVLDILSTVPCVKFTKLSFSCSTAFTSIPVKYSVDIANVIKHRQKIVEITV